LHLSRKDVFQQLVPAASTLGQDLDVELLVIGGRKEGKSLNMIPMEMGKRNEYVGLASLHLKKVLAELSNPRPGVDNANSLGLGGHDLKACRVATELCVVGARHGNGTSDAIELDLQHCDRPLKSILFDAL
jgi:hypothetical protein